MLQEKVTKGSVTKHPVPSMLCSTAIYRIAEKFKMTGSVLHRKEIQKCYVLTDGGCQNPHLTQEVNF